MKEKITILNKNNAKSRYSFNADWFDTIYQPKARLVGTDCYLQWSMWAYHKDIPYHFAWGQGMGAKIIIGDNVYFLHLGKDSKPFFSFYCDDVAWTKRGIDAMQKICEEICGGEEKFWEWKKFVESNEEWQREFYD